MRARLPNRPLIVPLAALFVVGAASTAALAQAWLPPKGEGTLSLGFVRHSADTHLDYRGGSVSPGDMIWNNVVSDIGYGITDRLAARVNLPLVVSKYDGAFPHGRVPGVPHIDDADWHTTFQDLQLELRFRATTGSLAVTPIVALVLPVNDYPFYGHGAAGRGLTEGHFGLAVGRLLDPVLPSAYVQARYLYGVPEKVLGLSHNRSQLAVELGYLIGSSLSLRAIGNWQKTHGGWRAPIDWPARTSLAFTYHDQLNRADYFRLGGGVSYALTGSLDVNVFGYGTVSGKSDVNMRGFGLSFSWSASPAQLLRKGRAEKPPAP